MSQKLLIQIYVSPMLKSLLKIPNVFITKWLTAMKYTTDLCFLYSLTDNTFSDLEMNKTTGVE